MTAARTQALDVYETAYLAGGPRRVVQAAVAALVERGRLRADALTGELTVVDPRPRHPVEGAVLDAVGATGPRGFETTYWRAHSDPRLSAVADRLRRDGLLAAGDRRLRAARRRAWTVLALTAQGRRTLRQLRAEPSAERAVALGGTPSVPDERLRAVFVRPAAERDWFLVRGTRFRPSEAHPHHGYAAGQYADGGGGGGFGGAGDGGGGGI